MYVFICLCIRFRINFSSVQFSSGKDRGLVWPSYFREPPSLYMHHIQLRFCIIHMPLYSIYHVIYYFKGVGFCQDHVYFVSGCAHVRPGAIRPMRPGADRPMSAGCSVTVEPSHICNDSV